MNQELSQQEKDIEVLSRMPEFARLMQDVDRIKDAAIADMVDAPTEKLQQIAGKLIAAKEILLWVDYESLKMKHVEALKKS